MNPFKVVEDFEEAIAEYCGAPYAVACDSATNALLLCLDYWFGKERDQLIINPPIFVKPNGHTKLEDIVKEYKTGSVVLSDPSEINIIERKSVVTIPHKTYVSVPQVIIQAGFKVEFDKRSWQHEGIYQLKPYPVWDCARLCTSGMYKKGQFMCLSLHWGKTLNLGQGGVILTDSYEAAGWFKKARWDGRTAGVAPKDDEITFIARHCPMSPRDAADALTRLHFLPKHNKPLPVEKGYADLSKFKVFK